MRRPGAEPERSRAQRLRVPEPPAAGDMLKPVDPVALLPLKLPGWSVSPAYPLAS
jgi:hypothetical protein